MLPRSRSSSAVGPGGTASDTPRILHAALGLPIRVIDGYKGTADIRLVTESSELAGGCLGWESLKTTWRKGIDSGEVNVVVQNIPKKQPELPGVPLLGDYVKTDEDRKLIKYGIQDTAVITRPNFLSPYTEESCPTTPQGLCRYTEGSRAVGRAKKANLDIDPISGAEVEAIVQGLYKIEPAFVARMKQVLVP